MLVLHVCTQLAIISAMATLVADPEMSAAGAQLVRREQLQDLVQSLVQQVMADGGACQPPVAGNSGERLGGGCSMIRRLRSPSVLVSLGY